MSKKKTVKCYIYLRVSTSMQVEGYSLDAQRERLQKFAEFQNIEIVREYCDAGKSGKSVEGRPEFTRMLKDIEKGRDDIDYILVFKLSRFGRNAADVLQSLQFIQDYNVNLVCVEDGIDSSKDSGKLTITVLSAVAEIERENILVQTMEGRRQKAREGKWNGGIPPYGYDLDSKESKLVINEKEAEQVKIIFDKFIHTDMGADSIAKYLNTHGYEKGKKRDSDLNYFTRPIIVKILDNPVYIGKITYGKRKTEKVKGTRNQYKKVDTDDYMMVDGLHDAIIDMETWEQARYKRKITGVKWNKTHSLEHEHLLTGIIKCPVCGGNLTGTVRRRKNKDSYKDDFYYRCLHRRKIDEEHFCDFRLSINQDELNNEVKEVITLILNDTGCKAFIKEKLKEKVNVDSLEKEREQLKKQLTQVNGAKKKLLDMIEKLDVTDKHYDSKYSDMQDRLDGLYDRINEIENEIDDVNDKIQGAYTNQITSKQIYQLLSHFDKMYDKMTDIERKEFFNNLLEEISIYPEKQKNGRLVKDLKFKFPIFYKGEQSEAIQLLHGNTDETLILLKKN